MKIKLKYCDKYLQLLVDSERLFKALNNKNRYNTYFSKIYSSVTAFKILTLQYISQHDRQTKKNSVTLP